MNSFQTISYFLEDNKVSSTSSSWKTQSEEHVKENNDIKVTDNGKEKDCATGCYKSKRSCQEHIIDSPCHEVNVNSKLTNILSAIMPRKVHHEISRECQSANDYNFEDIGYPLHGSGGICNWPGCENITTDLQLFMK